MVHYFFQLTFFPFEEDILNVEVFVFLLFYGGTDLFTDVVNGVQD